MTTHERDRYGGWTGKQFEATSFFRTEKDESGRDERWWLVTPDGNAFLSFGINHLHAYWWQQAYNRAACDALEAAENWRPQTDLSNGNETRDNVEFLKKVVAKYYQTARDAIRRYDPNHLFVGDKLNGNTDTLDTLLPITSQYTDVILYQMYGQYEVQKPGLDRWAKITDHPIINGDASFTMITEHMPRPYGPVADNLEQRAEWTAEFFRKAFARPEFVGWHYCGLIDAPNLIPRKQDRQHSGLMDGYGEPYPLLKDVIKACADEMYEVATRIDS